MKLFSRFGLLLAILLAGSYFLYSQALKPVDPKASAEIFVIPQGQNATTIAKRLKDQKLIKSTLAFRLILDRKDLTSSLQAGDFRLSRSMNLETIVDTLSHGSLDFWITFPEGLRAEEYAERLAKVSTIDTAEFILAAKPYEGQLFPDTYLIPQTASAQDVVTLLTDTFAQKSPTTSAKDIIIASMIEREAKKEQDRPLVSSVIHNRLEIGMALQIDATVQYVIGKSGNWWKQDLTFEDLKIDSPYNTYKRPGLPPKPIANPGLSALKAAASPATSDYLFYVSDSQGYNHYATDLEGHNANIDEYLN